MPITRVQILRRNDNFSQFRIRRMLSMCGNIETIKFTAVISAIFAFLSYFITLNMELAFFAPQWSWISNNFALTVCGGVFTSTLVVLFCEVQKYLSNKADCEQYLFYQTMYLYVHTARFPDKTPDKHNDASSQAFLLKRDTGKK